MILEHVCQHFRADILATLDKTASGIKELVHLHNAGGDEKTQAPLPCQHCHYH
jgi:hypothetical protein